MRESNPKNCIEISFHICVNTTNVNLQTNDIFTWNYYLIYQWELTKPVSLLKSFEVSRICYVWPWRTDSMLRLDLGWWMLSCSIVRISCCHTVICHYVWLQCLIGNCKAKQKKYQLIVPSHPFFLLQKDKFSFEFSINLLIF